MCLAEKTPKYILPDCAIYSEPQIVQVGSTDSGDAGPCGCPLPLAIQMDAALADLAPVYAAHPTVSELAVMAARLT